MIFGLISRAVYRAKTYHYTTPAHPPIMARPQAGTRVRQPPADQANRTPHPVPPWRGMSHRIRDADRTMKFFLILGLLIFLFLAICLTFNIPLKHW